MLEWYDESELMDDEMALQTAQAEASAKMARELWAQQESARQELARRQMAWEDRRGAYLRTAEREMNADPPIDESRLNELIRGYNCFASFDPDDDFGHLGTLRYDHGTGLENEDELADERERARIAAEEAARKKEEERQRRLEDRRKREEEARRRHEEEERQRRVQQTTEERSRIKAYLAELKRKRMSDAEAARQQDEDEARQRAEEDEARRRTEAEEAERCARETLEIAEKEEEERRVQIEAARSRESHERRAMGIEDMQSRQREHNDKQHKERAKAQTELLKLLYTPHEPYFDNDDDQAVDGAELLAQPRARRHVNPFVLSHGEAILEDVAHEKYASLHQSDRFMKLLKLDKLQLPQVPPARGGRSRVQTATPPMVHAAAGHTRRGHMDAAGTNESESIVRTFQLLRSCSNVSDLNLTGASPDFVPALETDMEPPRTLRRRPRTVSGMSATLSGSHSGTATEATATAPGVLSQSQSAGSVSASPLFPSQSGSQSRAFAASQLMQDRAKKANSHAPMQMPFHQNPERPPPFFRGDMGVAGQTQPIRHRERPPTSAKSAQ